MYNSYAWQEMEKPKKNKQKDLDDKFHVFRSPQHFGGGGGAACFYYPSSIQEP